MIVLAVICDGRRQYVEQTIAAAKEYLYGVDKYLLINDSDEGAYTDWLAEKFPEFTRIDHHPRRGLGGAVRSAWTEALKLGADYVWHIEDDMLITAPVDTAKIVRLLRGKPYLAQVVLQRSYFDGEGATGPFDAAPHEYDDHAESWYRLDSECLEMMEWVEHRRDGQAMHVFSFNPCLIPRHVMQLAIADESSTMLEDAVTRTVLDAGYRLAYFGNRDDPPLATHTGTQRSQGYRW